MRIHSLRMIITSGLFDKIKAAQVEASKEENWKSERITSYIPHLEDDSRGVKTRQGRIYILFRSHVKDLLLEEALKSKYSIHPGATKMSLDMKKNYWWLVEIDPELTSREELITILGRKSRQLRNKIIPLVKVEWKHQKGTSIRWEPEEKMRIRYPHLFQE
ncbi:hypothetical protein Tco_0090816 [Tanacetum coccineum]